MQKAVYKRPDKPLSIPVKRRTIPAMLEAPVIAEPLMIDKASECHVTPLIVARRMVRYLGAPGNFPTLEPSAGTGALVSALIEAGYTKDGITAVERHHKLAAHLAELCLDVRQDCFLEFAQKNWGVQRYQRIVMNPPFSKVGSHIKAALSLLERSGQTEPATLVALVPITFSHQNAEELETLPEDTFATCTVRTKIIRIQRV